MKLVSSAARGMLRAGGAALRNHGFLSRGLSSGLNSLPKLAANFAPLTPLHWLERAAKVYATSTACVQVDGTTRTWREMRSRCVRLGSALASRGLARGDVVQVMLDNTAEFVECHYGVPMSGATLGCINTRLDAKSIGYILEHSEAKALVYDERFEEVVREATTLASSRNVILVRVGDDYETFLEEGSDDFEWILEDEWDALSLNYTSGTTGKPKGVVGSHRGAYLTALSSVLAFNGLPSRETRMLWTVPMFHCNGWQFPYSLAAVGGVNVCLRSVSADSIYEKVKQHDVTHLCGAPIVLRFATEAMQRLQAATDDDDLERRRRPPHLRRRLKMMLGGAAPPPATLRAAEEAGIDVLHAYGLTEVYGPQASNEWDPAWNNLDQKQRALLKARQGVETATLHGFDVLSDDSLVPRDGETLGEVVFRGNGVMKGYLKDPRANEAAFGPKGDWFRSGDVGVVHADGYAEVKDRAKDIVISGGENISSLEVEAAVMEHPDVVECAVVARPDPTWGEHPCCFLDTKAGSELDEDGVIAFARTKLPGFKIPRSAVFGPLPKTATGKIQKFVLRQHFFCKK